MLIKLVDDCREFIAGDGSLLRELLHPDKADVQIRYSLAHATVPFGQATKPHRLTTAEVYYIIEGFGTMCIDDESEPVEPGSTVYIPPGATQSIENTGDHELVFLCIVDPAWQPQDEEIIEDG
ncbi:cupin domain-containing protein [Anaerobaca lacustris]|uniref:Cupin domain-containing protein n=1 Tax=Anaerobaca lacustris TaxID=3044600 RepID=A0AAW6TSY4_9BACT|nr:cupin domain-containing protein [Sedimentisphaerales bacterium M17dextr]